MSWQERKRPICLEKRFGFDNYSATRWQPISRADHVSA